MKVYIHGDGKKMVPARHLMFVTPGSHRDPKVSRASLPHDWFGWNAELNREMPMTFQVMFNYGEAEVDDRIGQYMLDTKLARRVSQRMRLIEPTQEEIEAIEDDASE